MKDRLLSEIAAIDAQLAKGDVKLKVVYERMKADRIKQLEALDANELQKPSGEVTLINVDPVIRQDGTIDYKETDPKVETTVLICSTCQKVCGSLAGLKAHERAHK